jgi:hypothetical protein
MKVSLYDLFLNIILALKNLPSVKHSSLFLCYFFFGKNSPEK